MKDSVLTACAASCAFLTITLLVAPTVQAEIMIDPFETNPPVSLMVNRTTTTDTATTSGSPIADDILGHKREATLEWVAHSNAGKNAYMDINYEYEDDVYSGVLDFIQDPRVQSILLLTWDGAYGNPWDLTGNTNLAIDVLFDDLPINLGFVVNSGASNVSQATLSLPGGIFSSETKYVPFSSFTGDPIIPGQVTAIHLLIDGSGAAESADVTLDNFRASPVPEPASLLMLGIAAALGFGLRRRKK
jgi:hypothetical protein